MYYVISDSPDIETFYRDIFELQKSLSPFTYDYITDFTDPMTPGGWGCARFSYPPPTDKIFKLPNVEYRYSDVKGVWQVDGVDTPLNVYVEGLHAYFVSLEGSKK